MTTAAECTAVAATVTAHAKKTTDGDAVTLAQAGQVLAGLGAGLSAASAPVDVCGKCSTTVSAAANRAAAAGDFAMAAQLRTAAKILANLQAGL